MDEHDYNQDDDNGVSTDNSDVAAFFLSRKVPIMMSVISFFLSRSDGNPVIIGIKGVVSIHSGNSEDFSHKAGYKRIINHIENISAYTSCLFCKDYRPRGHNCRNERPNANGKR